MNTIVLITDFGACSPYIAEMKGAILSVNNDVRIIDGTHAVPPQDIAHGAFVLRQLAFGFPEDTVFAVVVDPGVGTNRNILLVQNQNRSFIAPDNGILSHLFDDGTVRIIDQTEYWRDGVSSTFHGRDIMGPVAAHLSSGVPATSLATPTEHTPHRWESRQPQIGKNESVGEVVFVDSFGNLITNLSTEILGDSLDKQIIEFANESLPITTTYGDAAPHSPVALVGSSGHLEIAIVNGNAQQHFSASVGDSVRIRGVG